MEQATARPAEPLDGIIKLAILAVGGQGGGVLSDWIVAVAEQSGYVAQATSVPGVAQRTGATIYYIEMMPASGRLPVFSLMPSPGDVDILLAAEMMEAGRAIMRGLVTPDRTTLIASSHRALAVAEKIVPGDGIADSTDVRAAAGKAARRFIAFDMERIASEAGSVISASLFGALAGANALPFDRSVFEETIRQSGRGVEASLRAFAEAADIAGGASPVETENKTASGANEPSGPVRALEGWAVLEARVGTLPEPARDLARRGLVKVVDFQDLAYGAEYLHRLERVAATDAECGGAAKNHSLTLAAAKHIANAMAYDDVIRVADLKTRGSRFERVRSEMRVPDGAVLHLTEFMHPRAEEVCGMLPAPLGAWIESRPRLFSLLDRAVNRGRRVKTHTLGWFLSLYVLAGMRRWRRGLLRHRKEAAHLDHWLDGALAAAPRNYGLAVEMINCRRLIKGYSDTHGRGLSKFDRVLGMAPLLIDRDDAADWVRRLREAALSDEDGENLEGALATVRSFLDERQPPA
ncbi:MAG: indolepyruvate oxidoreductase subunit beta family protein [Rhizobiaceae bacterium]|nr:indolepyruvate oxidoreductase subunit beta family protein [Rhizobiaceae bacterium]MCV0407132.1 indolepyruvate oxidoreductase subunit beta family protein [Rhizobiaceae bacterium]